MGLGTGSGIGIGDWGLRLGLGIGDWDWRLGIGDCVLPKGHKPIELLQKGTHKNTLCSQWVNLIDECTSTGKLNPIWQKFICEQAGGVFLGYMVYFKPFPQKHGYLTSNCMGHRYF